MVLYVQMVLLLCSCASFYLSPLRSPTLHALYTTEVPQADHQPEHTRDLLRLDFGLVTLGSFVNEVREE